MPAISSATACRIFCIVPARSASLTASLPGLSVNHKRREDKMARLAGKVALITGAGTGIGRATARAMAAEGARIVVAEINAAAGEQTAQLIVQAGGDCIAVTTDVTEEASVRAAIDTAVRHYGALHILHNNA